MRLVSLALLMVCLLPGLAPGGSGTGQNAWIQEAEVFLTELFTIDGHAEEIPMERRADYLEERFGSFCEEEMLDDLMGMRLPFSIMQQAAEQGFDLSVANVALEVPELPGVRPARILLRGQPGDGNYRAADLGPGRWAHPVYSRGQSGQTFRGMNAT